MTKTVGLAEHPAAVLREMNVPEPRKTERRWAPKWALAAAGAVALSGAIFGGWRALTPKAASGFTAVEVRRGDLAKTISATGKLQAVTTVQVGTQVSGTVSELHADFNDRVKAGQVVARLDPAQFEAQYNQANATYLSAKARVDLARTTLANNEAAVISAQANVQRAISVVDDAEKNNAMNEQLVKEGVVARRTAEQAQAALAQAIAQKNQADAQVNQAKSQVESARAQVAQAAADAKQAQAAVELAKVNLDRTVIRSPIDGVVVARSVDVGQTVAASLQAPTLYLIANDLTQMQVLADIDEADVGQLGPDSKVTFTVDAFPADTFRGTIQQIRLAPQTVQNVVTYTAVVNVDNRDMKLKPGMTANITATVAERNGVLMVPNSALRFRPEGKQNSVQIKKDVVRARGEGATTARAATPGGATVWKVEDGALTPVRVKLGMSNGVFTEVTGDGLDEGDQIAAPAQQAASNTAGPRGSMFPMGGMRGGRR